MKNVIVFFMLFFLSLMNFTIAEDQVYLNILNVGSSAKMVRQGNIYGFSNKADSVFENPASLYRVGRFSSSFFRTTFMGDLTYMNGSVAVRGMGGVFGGLYEWRHALTAPLIAHFTINYFNLNALANLSSDSSALN